jgi:hypothetical protein
MAELTHEGAHCIRGRIRADSEGGGSARVGEAERGEMAWYSPQEVVFGVVTGRQADVEM